MTANGGVHRTIYVKVCVQKLCSMYHKTQLHKEEKPENRPFLILTASDGGYSTFEIPASLHSTL